MYGSPPLFLAGRTRDARGWGAASIVSRRLLVTSLRKRPRHRRMPRTTALMCRKGEHHVAGFDPRGRRLFGKSLPRRVPVAVRPRPIAATPASIRRSPLPCHTLRRVDAAMKPLPSSVSSTASPSAATSSKPAQTHTGSPAPPKPQRPGETEIR